LSVDTIELLEEEKEQALLLFCTVVSNVSGDGIKKLVWLVLPLAAADEVQSCSGPGARLGPGIGPWAWSRSR